MKTKHTKPAFEMLIVAKCKLEQEMHSVKDKTSQEYLVVSAKHGVIVSVIDALCFGEDLVGKVCK